MSIRTLKMDDFKTQFYNIEGKSVNEKKKNFLKLLKSAPKNEEYYISIKPRNQLEQIFYVDILIHFRITKEIMKLLKQGHGILTSKILKQKWFFQQVFTDMNENDLVNNVLPTFPNNLRFKMLKKMSLALSEEKMDRIFDSVLERYGLGKSQALLFSCSEEKIKQILTNYDLNLVPEQLKRLLQKNPDLVKLYFEQFEKSMGREYDDCDFLNYLCWKCPKLYLELELGTKAGIKLGKSTTKSVLKLNTERVIDDIEVHQRKLHRFSLTRRIQDFDTKCLPKIYPKNYLELEGNQRVLYKYLRAYPVKKRWEVLTRSFQRAYNKNIGDYLDVFKEDIVAVFPDDAKRRWSELMYSKTGDTKFLIYVEVPKALRIIKEKINVASNKSERITHLKQLITVCYKNNDYKAYEDVLKYVCARHRNDDLQTVLEHALENVDPKRCSKNHEKYVAKIVGVLRVKNNLPGTCLCKYMIFLYDRNVALDETIKEHVQNRIRNDWNVSLDFWYRPDVEREFLLGTYKVVAETVPASKQERYLCDIFESIVTFVRDKPEFFIDLRECPSIVTLIESTLNKSAPLDRKDYDNVARFLEYNHLHAQHPLPYNEHRLLSVLETITDDFSFYLYTTTIENVLTKPRPSTFQDDLLEFYLSTYFSKLPDYCKESKVVTCTLKNKPEMIQKHHNTIFEDLVKHCSFKYGMLRQYNHWGLDKEFIECSLNLLRENVEYRTVNKILRALSHLMNTGEYLDLVDKYLPSENKIDIEGENNNELYRIQCEAIGNLKNLDDPGRIIPILPSICQGDYLQPSSRTLYSTLNKTSEIEATPFIKSLLKQSVSVRKHSVSLAFQHLTVKEATDLFSAMSTKEPNVSVKGHIVGRLLKFFRKNPYEYILNTLVSVLDSVDKNDNETLTLIVESVETIPIRYRHTFIESAWKTFENFPDNLKPTYQDKILTSLTRTPVNIFARFSEEFYSKFIKEYFLTNTQNSLANTNRIYNIVIKYLKAKPETSFNHIFSIIRPYKEAAWGSEDNKKIKNLFQFFNVVYVHLDTFDLNVFNLFVNHWKVFEETEHFSGHCCLNLMSIYKNNPPQIKIFTEKANEYLERVTSKYGAMINLLLSECIVTFFSSIDTKKNEDFSLKNFVFRLLEIKTSELNCFLAVNIAQNLDEQEQNQIKPFIRSLQQNDNRLGDILYFSLLK